MTAAAMTGLLAATAAAGLQAPASAALNRVGAVDADTKFPSSYTDANGLSLALCLEGDPLCLSGPDLVQVHAAGGDAEAFYFAADAEVGPITVHNALEAAYAADGANQEIVFMRSQVSAAGGLTPNARYTITDPYGVLTCTADARGRIPNNDCRIETASEPRAFTAPLSGRIGPFLTWDTFVDPSLPGAEPPAGYIGDNVTPHKVLGSPTDFNKVRVEGPGFTGTCTDVDGTTISSCAETDLFVVQGEIRPGASAAMTGSRWDFGNVPAANRPTKSFTLRNTSTDGTALRLTGVTSAGSADFGLSGSCTTAGSLAPGATCKVDVTYSPTGGPATDTAVLTIASNLGERTINVTGSSVGSPVLAGATSLAFGDQAVNVASPESSVLIRNEYAAAATLTRAELVGPGSAHFALSETKTCATPVEPGPGCELGVVFRPTDPGEKTATLRLFFDGATTDPLTVPLTGTGVTTAPGVPTNVAVISGDATATVSWDAPGNDGGAAISGFQVTVLDAAGAVVQELSPATSPQSLTGLANGTTYTVQVRAGNSVGLSEPVEVSVRPLDLTAPTVTARTPAADATGVSRTANVKVTMSEAVAGYPAATSATSAVRLRNAATGATVKAAVTYNATSRVLKIDPSAGLAARTRYTVQLTSGVTDLAGNPLTRVAWKFTTGR